MSLISLIIFLIIIGAALYIINMLPIDGTIKKIIQVVVILVVLLYVLQILVGGNMPDLYIGGGRR